MDVIMVVGLLIVSYLLLSQKSPATATTDNPAAAQPTMAQASRDRYRGRSLHLN